MEHDVDNDDTAYITNTINSKLLYKLNCVEDEYDCFKYQSYSMQRKHHICLSSKFNINLISKCWYFRDKITKSICYGYYIILIMLNFKEIDGTPSYWHN